MKKIFLLILSAVMLTMCLTACGDSSSLKAENSIIGIWKFDNEIWRFTENGKIESINHDNKNKQLYLDGCDDYAIDGDVLKINNHTYKITKLTGDILEIESAGTSSPEKYSFVKSSLSNEQFEREYSFSQNNLTARLVLSVARMTSEDLIEEKKPVDKIYYTGPISDIPNNELGIAIKQALRDANVDSGYICIVFDPYNDDVSSNDNFAQYSEKESGTIVGQYPNPPKSYDEATKITLGKKA